MKRRPKPKKSKTWWSIRTIREDYWDWRILTETQWTASNEKQRKLKENFGKRIRRLRKKEQDWTQQKLAKESKLNRSHISEVEHWKCNVSLKDISKFAKAFKLYIYELLEFNPKNIENKERTYQEEVNLHENLWKRIQTLRKKKDRTQEKLAQKCHLYREDISKIENWKGNISLENIWKIAWAFNLNIHFLFQ